MCIEVFIGGWAEFLFSYFFWQFLSTCEKIAQFLVFCKDQGGKIQKSQELKSRVGTNQ